MHKRAFIIHGHQGKPDQHWLPWLEHKITECGFTVNLPQMPNPDWPVIEEWVSVLEEVVGYVDAQTYFVGHSLGAQAILRYVESLPSDVFIGGAVFVAGFDHINHAIEEYPGEYEQLKPWLSAPLHWEKIKGKILNVSAIFSDDDACVPVDNAELFQQNLDARILILHGKGHFCAEEGVTELPEALQEILRMSRQS